MNLVITASTLTAPTHETLEQYVQKRFKKIEKFLPKEAGNDNKLQISVDRSGDLFVIKAQIFQPSDIFVKGEDRDMRKAVDIALDHMMRILTEKVKK